MGADPRPTDQIALAGGRGRGPGETQLLIEVCDQLETHHGWRAGFVNSSPSSAGGLPSLLREGRSCLLVLDYAETRTKEIVALVEAALRTSSAPLVRLVLLAREGRDMIELQLDLQSFEKDKAVAAILIVGFKRKPCLPHANKEDTVR